MSSGNHIAHKLGGPKVRTILVVDDDHSVRELVALLLESEGYNVVRARNSEEAILFQDSFTGVIDLLWTDYCMKPFMNGLELSRIIRRARPGIRVIFSSGFADDPDLQTEMEATSSIFIAKPFSPTVLLNCVRACLSLPA